MGQLQHKPVNPTCLRVPAAPAAARLPIFRSMQGRYPNDLRLSVTGVPVQQNLFSAVLLMLFRHLFSKPIGRR